MTSAPLRHFPVRTEAQPPRWYALCGYDSANPKEFANPAKPEQVTCEGCWNYDRIKSAENWTSAIQLESENP